MIELADRSTLKTECDHFFIQQKVDVAVVLHINARTKNFCVGVLFLHQN
jgi:hypothetical protein